MANMTMRCLALASIIAICAASPLSAQMGTSTGEARKTDANCNAPSTVGNAQQPTTSMSIDKSAILPSAGGHANSAAPTVQSDGKSMQARGDCPPDTTSPTPSGK
ncbi:MAG: hypothetical protein ACOY4O_15100 [Pseudomonadota bacterium]